MNHAQAYWALPIVYSLTNQRSPPYKHAIYDLFLVNIYTMENKVQFAVTFFSPFSMNSKKIAVENKKDAICKRLAKLIDTTITGSWCTGTV